jgi:hypothetical protein
VIRDVRQFIAFCITNCIVLRPIEITEHLTFFPVSFHGVSSEEERSESAQKVKNVRNRNPLTAFLAERVSACIGILSPIDRPVLQQFIQDSLNSDSSMKAAHKD